MGQSDIIELLKRAKEPLSRGEIASRLDSPENRISIQLKKLMDYGEVLFEEIDKEVALMKYNCKKPMRLYFVK